MADAALARFYEALPQDVLAMVGGTIDVDDHAMHRALRDPDDPAAAPSPAVLNRLIREALPGDGLAVLDAGCGWGGTLLGLAQHRGARGLGVTLSALQADTATARAAALGLGERVRFIAADYTAHAFDPGAFDAITAVETLIHCPDKAAALAHLAGALCPGGRLILVDDMPTGVRSPTTARDLARFAEGWCAPSMPDLAGWTALLAAAGLTVVAARDLTPLYTPRDAATLAPLIAQAEAGLADPDPAAQGLRRGELGGFALEALYGEGAMAYRMVQAVRR